VAEEQDFVSALLFEDTQTSFLLNTGFYECTPEKPASFANT